MTMGTRVTRRTAEPAGRSLTLHTRVRRSVGRRLRLWFLTATDLMFRAAAVLRLRRSGDRKRVLLAASNVLMAGYVVRLWRTIADLDGVDAWMTHHRGVEAISTSGERIVDVLPLWRARVRRWDLILMADHMPLDFPRSIPKVIVPHGPGPSRVVRGGSYYYDRERVFWPDGEPVYRFMFDTSESAKARALTWVPEYGDRIVVVGDMHADELVAAGQRADQTRRLMGIGERTLVGVMSTWGPHGLMSTLGEPLIREIQRLVEEADFAFVLTMHQNMWDASRCGTSRWADLLDDAESEFIRVLRPGEGNAVLLGACHMALSDHTSLAMTFSSLRRPIIPVAVPAEIVGEGTFAHWLLSNRKPVREMGELRGALAAANTMYALDGAPIVVDHLGQSAALVRDALGRALGEPPIAALLT